MLKTGVVFFFILAHIHLYAQVVINEASNRNQTQIIDEDGEYDDWIELYNSGNSDLTLTGWALSDSRKNPTKWEFGNSVITAKGFLVVHASGKNRKTTGEQVYWESAVLPTDQFSYLVPSASTPTNWFRPEFNDVSWGKGQAGFGYGDNDDRTVVPSSSVSVFIRIKFTIPDTAALAGAILHVDYDDGFMAYMNGTVIARFNLNENPQWNTLANGNHEAVMYNGGTPEAFQISKETLNQILVKGENVLALRVHNVSTTSSDLSLIPFLSFAVKEGKTFFKPVPTWFIEKPAAQLHANFKLSGQGERVFLSRNGQITDSLYVPEMFANHSIGRVTNGAAQTGFFTTATPGKSNNTTTAYTEGYTGKPSLSLEPGFYFSAKEVAITSTEPGVVIRYTLDGSEPTASSSVYSTPISISTTRCLKARCFVTNKLPGKSAVATYFMNIDFTLPVLSVSTTRSNLYGSSGIFDNHNQTWDIPAYVEYFGKDEKLAFSQYAGMQVDGGAGGSREPPKHSFRMEPGNRVFGEGDLKYKLMHRRPNRNNYPSFYVRNGSNQRLTLQYKDGLQVTALGQNTYTYYSAYQPIVVFINGEYFGVYELREKINDDYLVDNYGMNIDSLDLLGVSYFKAPGQQRLEALRGSIDPYIADVSRFLGMNNQSGNYLEKVDQFLDIRNYTDYIIAESWVANNDWPFNNIKVFRCKSTGYRWQWAIIDLEWSLKPNHWTDSGFDHIQYMKDQGRTNYYTGFWFNMMENPDYRAYFINRFADLMNSSYHFSVIGPLENEMYNEMFPEIEGDYQKWGSNTTAQPDAFTRNHQTFRSELEKRGPEVRKHLQKHYGLKNQVTITLDVEPRGAGSIQISTLNPPDYPWSGIYFTDVPLVIEAIPNPGYSFSHWEPNSFMNDVYSAYQTSQLTGTSAFFKAHFETDEFSYEGVAISEFMYKPGKDFDSPDWIELCNFGPGEVNLKNWYLTDNDPDHIFFFKSDLILAANQRIVVTRDLGKFRSLYPFASVYSGEMTFGLATPDDEINLRNHTGSLIASVQYSDHYPWALSNDQSGRSLELRSPGASPDEAGAWFRGCIGGSPGIAYLPCEEQSVSSPLPVTRNFTVKAFPVPADDFVNVEMFLEETDQYYTFRLYDLKGSLLKTISSEQATTGWHTLQVQLDQVRGNLCFLRVTTSRNEKLIKILKM